MEAPVGMMLQPFVGLGRIVGGDIVENDMHLGSGLDAVGHVVEEGEELFGAVPLRNLTGHPAGGDIKGRQKAGGAVALVVVGEGLRMARLDVIGKGFCVRESVWICVFSSTERTTAWSGGLT